MYRYTLHYKADDTEAFATILDPMKVGQAVRELSGRDCSPWLSKNLHRKGVCYVARNRSHGGGGFIVRRNRIEA